MSQEKVDRYKTQKANRKNILKKRKIKKVLFRILFIIILLIIITFLVWWIYNAFIA
jgi:cell division septal protein FtsQ